MMFGYNLSKVEISFEERKSGKFGCTRCNWKLGGKRCKRLLDRRAMSVKDERVNPCQKKDLILQKTSWGGGGGRGAPIWSEM